MDEPGNPPTLRPVDKPLNLIPVGLKEAALDSPTFRATATHFADQIDSIERWLDGLVKTGSKLTHEIGGLEALVNTWLQNVIPPPHISEAVLDHDYTLLATKRYSEAVREFWHGTFRTVRKSETNVIEPIKSFINNDLRHFKDIRKALDYAQRAFDGVLSRYASQGKSKEASSLREDAFQLHEARKAYLKASMDFCIQGPIVRSNLDKLLVKVFSDQWNDIRKAREGNAVLLSKWNSEMDRIRGWSKEMEGSERAFKRELQIARKQIEEAAEQAARPPRELDEYNEKAASLPGGGAVSAGLTSTQRAERQGWLYIKTVTGKPARTAWSRRWFFVKNGIFGSLVQGTRSGGVEESEKIGVLLCSVRPAGQEERRFCFEVKTKDTSIILQAETQHELSHWISAFDVAKRRALEFPASSERSTSNNETDPAFAISPPVAPEFAARSGEGHMSQASEDQTGNLSTLDPGMSSIAARSSVDVTSGSRSSMMAERDAPEGSRDHAARIIQKLDLHRKSTPSSSVNPAAAGGIASLISASHNVLPVGPGTPAGASSGAHSNSDYRSLTMPPSTLAPSTMANPPAPTNLSKTAVIVSGERNVSLSYADGSGVPGGIMANLWGSEKWGTVNRLERGDTRVSKTSSSPSASPASKPTTGMTLDDNGVMDGMDEAPKVFGSPAPRSNASPGRLGHRKTGSLVPELLKAPVAVDEGFPNYYPVALKAQDAQFRMLFPDVPRSEKVVLVFRATWNPNEEQEFPGRIYVTAKEVFFYSHHLGLVLVSGVALATVSEVTAAPGRDCDFLYVHLKDDSRPGDSRRVTIKTFLEPLKLLQRRLNFLVHNANAETPASLEEVIKGLIKMEISDNRDSPSGESWDDLDDSQDDNSGLKLPKRREQDVKRKLRIDGTLYGENVGRPGREVMKFKLPAQAVVFVPQGMGDAIVTRDFSISAKALFHVVFGDKSAVFQVMYCNRWANSILQSPWTKGEDGHFRRTFAWELDSNHVQDVQVLDVNNDHLCYMVTDNKTPWAMPLSNNFHLVTKYVITHSAKSQCRFAIFHKIVWHDSSGLAYSRRLVENRAASAIEADALDLTTVAMDQVAKLGARSKTNRAVHIFGSVGQATETLQVSSSALPQSQKLTKGGKRKLVQYSLASLYVDEAFAQALRIIGFIFDLFVALAKSVVGAASAHTLLVALLTFSMAYNTWYGYCDGMTWYRERRAGKFMAHLGVTADPTISRAIYLHDIGELVIPPSEINRTVNLDFSPPTCKSTFQDVITWSGEYGAEQRTTSRAGSRLSGTRHRLARQRHDLLVAMRVVNRIEGEVVQAEWEDWARDENERCDHIHRLLSAQKAQGKKGKKSKDIDNGQEVMMKDLGEDFEAYCKSCKDESLAINAGHGRLM